MNSTTNLAIKNKKYREKIKSILRKFKQDSGCKVCGFNEHWVALDFHHRNPETKLFTISENKNIGMTKLLTEIDKCDVICVNCHRKMDHANLQSL